MEAQMNLNRTERLVCQNLPPIPWQVLKPVLEKHTNATPEAAAQIEAVAKGKMAVKELRVRGTNCGSTSIILLPGRKVLQLLILRQ